MFLTVIILVIIGMIIWVIPYFVAPFVNGIFSSIWSEEERPMIKREAQERLAELFIDGDVPEETAVIMTAREQDMEEQELLNMFQATDAKALARLIKPGGMNKALKIFNAIAAPNTKGMIRKRR